jgi:pimeloyl-ACP methyl ester carboxylesterase
MSSVFANTVQPALSRAEKALNSDPEIAISAAGLNLHFALKASDSVLIHVVSKTGNFSLSLGKETSAEAFILNAPEESWRGFFTERLQPPFQSFWGMLRVLGQEKGVFVSGDNESFAKSCRVWRLVLDRLRDAVHGPKRAAVSAISYEEGTEDDDIIGRYVWIDTPFGRTKIFCESAGSGPQHILFLHTAGADSRQFHSLMNDKTAQARCSMYAFDLPGHGRSYPGETQFPGGYKLDEESYIDIIGKIIGKLNLHRPIVCGASMAGHICLAVAIRASELNVGGVIPCEASDHVAALKDHYAVGALQNESILNSERVCGLISPTAPAIYYQLTWWIYSSQAAGIFPGDLKFYFNGWDGRDRTPLIDTKKCPVYMLTGEYDYSCTVAASKATAEKIPGAIFEEMQGLGHFPMTEQPKIFLPYFLRALDFIQQSNSV